MKYISNPENPWHTEYVEWLGEPPEATLEVFEQQARSILSENNSPDIPFDYSVNPYRGCYHGCVYCYARPTHQFVDFGAGTDFERKIVVKTNAPEKLHEAVYDPDWRRAPITFSGVTDCYQPLEATYELTKGCLEVCAEIGNPVAIITKGALVRRDIDLLAKIHDKAGARVHVSIPFADDETGWVFEPHATAISQRFKNIELLSDAGIPTGVAAAPMIPGLNDSDIPEILERAKEAGASRAFMTLLRLPREVKDVFFERIEAELSTQKVGKIKNSILDTRDGELNNAEFGERMTGEGPRWKIIEALFDNQCRKFGLNGKASPQSELEAQGTLQGQLWS